MGNPVKDNPLRTRKDVERAAAQLIRPLIPLLSPGRARLHLGDTGAAYPEDIAQMEGYARPLWALVPMLMGNCRSALPLWEKWREGLINGTDPNHPEYWGQVSDFDQRLVEMAVLGTGLCLIPDQFYHGLPGYAQKNLWQWLNQINHHDMPQNNWIFFRVLVNTGFLLNGLDYPKEQLEADLANIDTHYEGDGWYFDYFNQREYYTMWAFHYYGLIYARVMKEHDPRRCRLYIGRAKQMAKDFACWFDKSGEALPYGRSLTYRFAQGAFYAALALAEGDQADMDYGEMKHLLLGNMRTWFQKPIFTRDGVLTIGYGYPNLMMGEGYNAPGSPYWAMKAFACLALPAQHPFWKATEKQVETPLVSLQPHARMLMVRSADHSHVMGFQAGNHAHEHAHDEAKYEKFVYSTAFGFSVSKAQKLLKCGAFDNMLALSEDGDTYHPRYGCESFEFTQEKVVSTWHPFKGVTVHSTLIPVGEWHVRIHRIHSDRELYAAEGGYAIARSVKGEAQELIDEGQAAVIVSWGISGLKAFKGYQEGIIVIPEPNTNLMVSRTLLPTLTARLPKGDSLLVCAVLGTVTGGISLWENIPTEVITYAQLA